MATSIHFTDRLHLGALRHRKPPTPVLPEALARLTDATRGAARVALPGTSPPTRRTLLRALGAPGDEGAEDIVSAPRPRPAGRGDPVLMLVHRITQGFNLAEYQRAKALGYDAYLEEQLDHLAIDDSAMDARLAGFTTLAQSPKELVDAYSEDIGVPLLELKEAVILRSVYSKRQLFERMCEFWSDHFNIDHQQDIQWALKSEDDRDVIRKHALGTFPELLSASAHSGSMLYYLDNWLNFAGAPQENYARELLELHTLGVNGGYTEEDVKEVAKCLTGWTLNPDPNSPDWLRFQFISQLAQGGQKFVLGQTIPAVPKRQAGEIVLQILGAHPSTAAFISRKLIHWLLTETPSQALVDQVAQTYLSTGGDIKAMLRVILSRDNLLANSSEIGPKFRRPFHFMVSLLRGMEAEIDSALIPYYLLFTAGHSPFDWHPPNGYPDTVGVWGKSMLPRWNIASLVTLVGLPGVTLSQFFLFSLLGGFGAAGLARRIDERILGSTLSRSELRALQSYIDGRAPVGYVDLLESIALAASAPGFQWT